MYVLSDVCRSACRDALVTGHCHPMQPLSARACFVILVAFLAGIAAQSRYAHQHQKRTTLTGDTFSDEAPGHECAPAHVQLYCSGAYCLMTLARCMAWRGLHLYAAALLQVDL